MNSKSTIALSLTCLWAMLLSCEPKAESKAHDLVLTNRSKTDLTENPFSVKRNVLTPLPEDNLFPLLLSENGDTVAVQADDIDGDGQWDELFFVTDLPADGQKTLQLSWTETQPVYNRRTSVRFGKRNSHDSPVKPRTSDTLYAHQLPKSIGYQPYQTDGPSWENDKVGFRHYFDGRNAKDLFGKKVSYMSPEEVGVNAEGAVEDNYHVMEEWGRDILAVGNSAGIGGIALLAGDSLIRLGVTVEDSVNNIELTTFNIVTEGPVRSVIDFSYQNRQYGDRSWSVKERTSIWPGMHAFQNMVQVSDLQGDEKLLVGLVNSRTDKPLTEVAVNDDWVVLMTHDKQTYEKDWWLGLALILPRKNYAGFLKAPDTGKLSHSYFGKLEVENNQPVTYYVVAGWELSNPDFSDSVKFTQYVQNLATQLSAQADVQVR